MTQTPIKVNNQRYRLGYHLMPASGWMNDPNGFSYFKGYYHLFYQYYPYASEWGPMHWGHARSKDLIHWETLPVALKPTRPQDGCFSGSAVVYQDKLWLIYTGHHVLDAEKDINRQDQNLAYSTDGIHFEKYEGNPVIAHAPEEESSADFRDPKVWQEDDHFKMVVGSRDQAGLGRVLLYESQDLKHWEYEGTVSGAKSVDEEGFMWECPDFFRLNGQDILLTSPQGIKATQEQFLNQHNTGYFVGQYSTADKQFERGSFTELDNGHDLYATQTLVAPDGRRVMVAWMNAWDSPMTEKPDGWCGAITLPRELTIKNNRLYQNPVAEALSLREAEVINQEIAEPLNCSLSRHTEVKLDLNELPTGTILKLADKNNAGFSIEADQDGHHLILTRNSDPENKRYAMLDAADKKLSLRIFIDSSSAEIFVNDGEVVFTERIYWQDKPALSLNGTTGHLQAFELSSQTNSY
ncbi:glycoside hydrolase family 32 protein [Limosilactobacillus mucosae]